MIGEHLPTHGQHAFDIRRLHQTAYQHFFDFAFLERDEHEFEVQFHLSRIARVDVVHAHQTPISGGQVIEHRDTVRTGGSGLRGDEFHFHGLHDGTGHRRTFAALHGDHQRAAILHVKDLRGVLSLEQIDGLGEEPCVVFVICAQAPGTRRESLDPEVALRVAMGARFAFENGAEHSARLARGQHSNLCVRHRTAGAQDRAFHDCSRAELDFPDVRHGLEPARKGEFLTLACELRMLHADFQVA